jgi:AmmeMemoRadiSam system protein B
MEVSTSQRDVDGCTVREPAVAGAFYPCDPVELRAVVHRCLADARGRPAPSSKAILAPHAGYAYSGPIAGSAFAALAPSRGRVRRVVLLGPAHHRPLSGLAVPQTDAFATPLGPLRVDAQARTTLLRLPQVVASEEPHEGEHCIEVELPFVLEVLGGDVTIVPILAGDATDAEAAEVLDLVWDGPETCVVVSSDLSHYHPRRIARRIDRATAHAIEHLAPEEIEDSQACGFTGVRALLRVTRARELHSVTLDVRTSGDTTGPHDQVVGYGAFSFG